MSFTSDVKNELCHVKARCSHCDKALLAALVRVEGSLCLTGGEGGVRLEVATDIAGVARLVVRLFHELYDLKTEVVMRRSVLHKNPNYLIELPAQPGLREALAELGVLGPSGMVLGLDESIVAKGCCAAAYVRGVFLGSGFIGSPEKDFHFEMTLESEALAADLAKLLSGYGIDAKVTRRRNLHTVYLKSGGAIADFLAFTEAHSCALKMENVRTLKSMRNDVNRQVNAELANQAKAMRSSIEQINTIHALLSRKRFEEFPPALREYMRVRVRNPEATLKELGEACDPPLSKSAIHHRARRVEELARAYADLPVLEMPGRPAGDDEPPAL